jgi:hypothetical protein
VEGEGEGESGRSYINIAAVHLSRILQDLCRDLVMRETRRELSCRFSSWRHD